MLFQVTFLASGSSGNAALIRSEGSCFLIDAGLSAKQLTQRLSLCDIRPSDITAILITHEHSDHVKGLPQWCKQHNTPIYCNRHTAMILSDKMKQHHHWKIFETGSSFSIQDFSIQSFSIPHDAVDPVGFIFRKKNRSFGFATDLGYATNLVLDSLRHVDGLLIEANYDEELLHQDTKRPWAVKQRIASRHGHLANNATAALLKELLHDELKYVILGHLSADCNRPDLALQTIEKVLTPSSPIQRWCASPDIASKAIILS